MAKPVRLYVDFNKSGVVGIPLTTIGTQRDLLNAGVDLADGLELSLYQDDAVDGKLGYLAATAVTRWIGDHWEAELTSDIEFQTG